MTDWLSTLGFAMGSAWISGINLYAMVITLGLLQRLHMVNLPGDLEMVQQWWVIGLAAALYLVEFIADKVPAIDSVWDAIHTFIRVPSGAILAASAFADFSPGVWLAALLLGGGLAFSSHGTKATVRLVANTSPEPVSNIALSLFEDFVAFGLSALMAFHPLVVAGIVVALVLVGWWVARRVARGLAKAFRGRPRTVPGDFTKV